MSILHHAFDKSTMFLNCAYDTEAKYLIVVFNNGKEYAYVDVDKSIYDALITAQSAGKYFNSIKAGLTQK
jgi:predicted transcriptional regulator